MGCEICGKTSCTRSFHSLEDQSNFDEVADKIKDRMRNSIERDVNKLQHIEQDQEVYVKLDDVINVIQEYY